MKKKDKKITTNNISQKNKKDWLSSKAIEMLSIKATWFGDKKINKELFQVKKKEQTSEPI